MDLMNASAERLVDVLARKAKAGQPVEIWRLFGCLTMEVVGSTAFGLELRTLEGDSKAIGIDDKVMTIDDEDDDATQLQKCAAVLFGFSGARVSPYVALNLLIPDAAPLFRRLATRFPDAALGKALKARLKIQAICFRLIGEAKQRMQAEASSGGVATADAAAAKGDGSKAATNGDSKAATNGGPGTAASGAGQLPRRRVGPLPPGGFISHLLSSDNKLIGRKLTDFEVAAQAFTFLLAGYETTASALAFTAYWVARSPDKEAKLLAEIDAFGRAGVPTFDDLGQFPYLDAVFSEALRLSPPAAFGTIRAAREDFQVCGGLTIRKGWFINTAQYSFQNNPKYWGKDHDQFIPERFLTERGTSMAAWAPFGDGGRSCVGIRFAKAEAKIALIRLYQSFTLRLTDGQIPLKTKTTITMAPKHGIKVMVHPRP
jgi:cytochrome P450